MTPDTAAAILAADPPEIAAARRLINYHTALHWPTVAVQVSLLRELVGAVDYLRAQLADARQVLAEVAAARADEAAQHVGPHHCVSTRADVASTFWFSPTHDCPVRQRWLTGLAAQSGGEG